MTSSLAPAPERRRYLGLDLGGTNIKVVVIEERGPRRRPGAADHSAAGLEIVARETYPTEAHRGPTRVVERLAEVGRDAAGRHGPVAATGVGLPGLFEAETGRTVLIPNLPGDWNGVPVRDPLVAALGQPVALINDARAFSLAEALLGAARGLGTVVCMVLGTGVGGGVVVDGRLLRGTGTAGEIGHQTVLAGGPACGCGNAGCVEALTRADVFAQLGGRATAEEVYAAARMGDALACAAVDHVVKWLGVALANAYVLLAPDAFVVGGGIAAAGDLLLGPLQEAVRHRVFIAPPERVRILPAALGPYAGASGAALYGWEAASDTLNTASMA
jgi:glucokinase